MRWWVVVVGDGGTPGLLRVAGALSGRMQSAVAKTQKETGRTREAYITIKVKLPDRAVTTFWRKA